MITKEQLTDAHEQGLIISTRNGNIKIVAILNDVYGVNHFSSNKVQWWLFEQFEKQEATIEQPKPKIDFSILKEGDIYFAKSTMYEYVFKFRISSESAIIWDSNILLRDSEIYNGSGGIKLNYVTELRLPTESELELFYSKFPDLKPKKYNGRAVKCDTVDQLQWLFKTLADSNYEIKNIDINNCFNITIVGFASEKYYIENNYEIISFSQYCKENGITEPKWIQGFEVRDGYNDVVMVSDDKISINTSFPNVEIRILKEVREHEYPFKMQDGSLFEYARYPRKNEFNEIKFSN